MATNSDAIFRALTAARGALPDAVASATSDIARDISRDISTPGGGRHSKPGQRPRLQTGRLAGGIRATSRGLTGRIRSAAPYGAYVEFGTRRQGARPFFRPGVLQGATRRLRPRVAQAITRAERRAR